MKIQNNLNKIIYKSIIFVIAYIPISVHAIYKDCEAITPFYIKDGFCAVQVQNCKDGNRVVSGTARCDTATIVCPASPLEPCDSTQCPTDPNECVNDNESDGITNYTNTAPPMITSEEPYHSCEKIGDTTIKDDKCTMSITGCKQGNSDTITTAIATCNVQGERNYIICNRMQPAGCSAGCPTDPNECANDDESDGKGNYKNTETIRFVDGGSENYFQRRNDNTGRPQ